MTTTSRSASLALALSFSLSALAVTAAGAVEMRRNVAYGPHPETIMDLCLPDDRSSFHPGVLLIHGGGWIEGDKDDMAAGCAALAARGVIGITIDYRLARRADPASHWPAQLADSQLAVRWVRAHAADLRLDADRICAWGESAGGQLALMLGVRRITVASDEAAILGDRSPAVRCVVANSAPTDLTTVGPPLATMVSAGLFGGASRKRNPRLFRSASPALLLRMGAPPMLLFHGTRDPAVPYAQASELVAVARRNAVPVTLETYAGGHLGSGLDKDSNDRLFREAIDFLLRNSH